MLHYHNKSPMKKFSYYIKYSFFAFTLIVGVFALHSTASANQYTYGCLNGGIITSDVNISPSGPFAAGATTHFDVTATIRSTCSFAHEVSLTAQNNNGTTNPPSIPIISNQILAAGGAIGPAGSYGVTFITAVEDDDSIPPGGNIGNVFSIGPHMHGASGSQAVAYVGQPIHPQFTVRVKNYGATGENYVNTTNPTPPDIEDSIYIVPQGYASTPIPQIVTCSSNCGIPISGYNYSAVSSVSVANVGKYIPVPYHVCSYPDAPALGYYFSPAQNTLGAISPTDTCQYRYPDADIIR
jgi:hypothetical protein